MPATGDNDGWPQSTVVWSCCVTLVVVELDVSFLLVVEAENKVLLAKAELEEMAAVLMSVCVPEFRVLVAVAWAKNPSTHTRVSLCTGSECVFKVGVGAACVRL